MIEPARSARMPRVWAPAWHGAIGEAVHKIAPATEADPIAVLATSLAMFGAMCGDGPHVRVGGVRHPARIWPLVVGQTGQGRKGTSLAEARRIARAWGPYAETYTRDRMPTGLSSGEGLIAQLGGAIGHRKDDVDVAAPDGRLTVVETEFARVLTASKRDGNTLGPIMRQLWEDGSAGILTRAAPLQVSGAHLGVIAHITPGELRIRLAESDLVGGTLNRFLLISSDRPRLLAHEVDRADTSQETALLTKHLDRARFGRELHRDRSADQLWVEVYEALSADEPDGQLGSVLARGPAYTMRLALVYALADGAGAISVEHLVAGLAVWAYAAASARMVFPGGRDRRDGDQDKLIHYLSQHSQGVTRTDISTHFARNRTAGELDDLLDELLRDRVIAASRDDAASTPGRPALRYQLTGRHRDPVARLLSRFS